VMVLMDAPAHGGCLIEIRMLGVIEAEQTEEGKTERNDRLLGVAVHSYDHQDLDSIDDVSKTLLDQVELFSSLTTSSAERNSGSSASADLRKH
jgi:inorganic pyrophosphatase